MSAGSAPRPPLVAVSTTQFVTANGRQRVGANVRYAQAVAAAGGVPLLVPPGLPHGGVASLLERVDALLLTGGGDVDPARYGRPAHPATEAPEAGRDELELALLAEAERRALPTLCICRGVQVLNVYRGGTLVQDLPSERPDALPHDPGAARTARVHAVFVDADSRLARVLGATSVDVNSFHHQAADAPGHGLRAVARSGDGVVEGLEVVDSPWWALGVQWHPEELVDDDRPWDRALFAAFVREAAATVPAATTGS